MRGIYIACEIKGNKGGRAVYVTYGDPFPDDELTRCDDPDGHGANGVDLEGPIADHAKR